MKALSSFSSVSLGNHLYVLAEQSLYRIKYDDITSKWEKLDDLDNAHGPAPTIVSNSGMLYIVGGGWELGVGMLSKTVSKYDTSLNRWERLKDKSLATDYSAIVASKGNIYCIGGFDDVDGLGASAQVERLNVVLEIWEGVSPMNETRWGASAVECNEMIVVAGGWSRSDQLLKSVEIFDPFSNQWTFIKPMTKGRYRRLRLHTIEDNLYAVGGDQENRTIEKYDSLKDRWNIVHVFEPEIWICESVTVRM